MNQSTTVREALVLRYYTLLLLSRALTPGEFVRAVSSISVGGWRYFISVEACATPLRQALGAAISDLPNAAGRSLDEMVAAELQRMLAATLQMNLLERAAIASQTMPIVLKGGVPIGEGKHAFDLGDIDLLVDESEADRLEKALIHLGADAAHALRFPGTLTTEIHTRFDAGAGVVPASRASSVALGRFAQLRRLAPVGHAAYIVQHCTTHHVERRGNLRDTMLLVDELRGMTARDVDELRASLASLPDADLYERFLNRALCVLRGRPLYDDRDTARIAAAHYALNERWPTENGFVSHTLRVMTMFLVGSAGDLPRAARLFLFNPVNDQSRWMAHRLAKRAPWFWRGISYIVRTPYRLALVVYASAVAIRFRMEFDAGQWNTVTAPEPR